MNTVVLIGTAHSIQRGENCPDLFEAVLQELCANNMVHAIAEEINEGTRTVASMLAQKRQIEHLYADPGNKERQKRGIATNIEWDVSNEFGDAYPEIRFWPREPNSENLPQEVWKEYFKRIEESYRAREQIWLEKIISLNKWPLLFICGASHFEPFSGLLKLHNICVFAPYKDWSPE